MKGHGAADWSKRPLPADWLNYAALDVEVLLELRAAIAAVLEEQGKTDWAAQEFEYLRTFVAPPTRRDRWRRTSGIHKVRNPRTLAAVRELWTTRDQIAQRRDIAPGRILPDAAIINAATVDPDTVEKLTALPIFGGSRQRRSAQVWLDALARARATEDLPTASEPHTGPPPASRWARRKPEAAARLEAARSGLDRTVATAFGAHREPADARHRAAAVLGLAAPDDPDDTAAVVDAFLAEAGARPWQRELTVPVLTVALTTTPDADARGRHRSAESCRPADDAIDVRQEVRQHRLRRLDLRPVPDVVGEHHHVGVGNHLGVALGHVPARIRVDRAVDQPHRHVGLPHGAHPPVAVRVAVREEPADLVQHPAAVVEVQDLVELSPASGATAWCSGRTTR